MLNVTTKRRAKYKNSTQMDVSAIRFTQKSINDTFSNGTPIKWTIYMLQTKQILPIEIPLIRVGFYNGYYKSIDNRRLYCYKQANIKTIPVIFMEEITKEFKYKDQSPNNGISVKIIHDPKPASNEIVTAYNPLTGKSRTWTVKNIMSNKTFYCDICRITMSSKNKRDHLNGKKHKSNLAKYEANNRASLKKSSSINEDFYCDICETYMNTVKNQTEHLNGKRHKTNLLKAASMKPVIYKINSQKPQKHNDQTTLKALSQKTKEIQDLNTKLKREKLKCKSLVNKNTKLSLHINQMAQTINDLRNKIYSRKHAHAQQAAAIIDDEKKSQSEADTVRIWMQEIVKLSEYFEVLVNNGFDDLDIIADITNDDLIDIGIHKIGHRKKILKFAMELGDRDNTIAIANIPNAENTNINQVDDIDKFHDELAHDISQDFDNAFNDAYQSVYTQQHEGIPEI